MNLVWKRCQHSIRRFKTRTKHDPAHVTKRVWLGACKRLTSCMSAPTTEIATTAKSLMHAKGNCNSEEFMSLLVDWYFELASESIRFFRLELPDALASLCSEQLQVWSVTQSNSQRTSEEARGAGECFSLLGHREQRSPIWPYYQLNSSCNCSANRSCWCEFPGTWSHYIHAIGLHCCWHPIRRSRIGFEWQRDNRVTRSHVCKFYHVGDHVTSHVVVWQRGRLGITCGDSNQQDQLERAEVFIFSNCRDPVVVYIKN